MMWKNAIQRLWDNNRIRKTCRIALFGLVLSVAFMNAIEVDATGYIESQRFFEGDSKNNQSSAATSNTSISVGRNCYFDTVSRNFYTTVSGYGSEAIESNVCDGMIVQGDVLISVARGVSYELYKDGVLVENFDEEKISEPGSYVVSVSDNSGKSETPLSFTIVGKKTNDTSYTFSNNCRISSVTRDGVGIRFSGNHVELPSEGNYEIVYKVDGIENQYKLNLEVDTTPPTLALAAVDENGRANGPVDISDVENNSEIYITRDGESVSYSKELTAPGTYTVILIDEAGNRSVYTFTILIYFDLNSMMFFISLALVLVGVIAYMIYIKKHLRVR